MMFSTEQRTPVFHKMGITITEYPTGDNGVFDFGRTPGSCGLPVCGRRDGGTQHKKY
jgi:hypothetical protein